jgi:hypothetical protein
MFEALVDLDNLVSDRHYAERMNAADHREMIKLLKEAPSNPLLVGLAAKHPVGELLATLEAQLADMENRNLGPLPVFARCKTAGRQHEYKTVYAMLCLDAHNNVTALMERHVIPVEGGSVELAPFGDGEPVVLARRLSFAMHWMLQSAEFVHGAFKTGYSVADFQQQHDVMRKALDPSPTHTNPTV